MSRSKGEIAEKRAAAYLEKRGYAILDRNFHSRFGEIDIVAYKNDTLHFVEVKSGPNHPAARITPAKLSKILKTARIYMSKNRFDCDFCLDAVIVDETIELIENITF